MLGIFGRYPMQQKWSDFPSFLFLNLKLYKQAKCNTSRTTEFTNNGFCFCSKEQKGKGNIKPNGNKEEKPWGENGFSFRKFLGSDSSSQSARNRLGWKSLLQPEGGGRAAAECPPVDAPQPQQVEQDGQQDHQEAAGEQVVIIDEGEAPPVGVTGPEGLLLDIS